MDKAWHDGILINKLLKTFLITSYCFILKSYLAVFVMIDTEINLNLSQYQGEVPQDSVPFTFIPQYIRQWFFQNQKYGSDIEI